jgi:hypothetical protein
MKTIIIQIQSADTTVAIPYDKILEFAQISASQTSIRLVGNRTHGIEASLSDVLGQVEAAAKSADVFTVITFKGISGSTMASIGFRG